MTDHPDPELERTIARSLDDRSRHLGTPAEHIDGVFARVDRRRARRRSVAVIGAFAVVGLGMVGMATLSGDPADPLASQPVATSEVIDQAATDMTAWRCLDQLEYWGEQGDELYFATCERVAIPGDVPILETPPGTTPGDDAPQLVPTTTTIVPLGSSPVMSEDIDCLSGSTPDATVAPVATSPTEQRYTIVPGDSLASIGERYGIDPNILANYNSWPECLDHLLLPGDVVFIPPNAALVDILPTTTVP